MPYCFVIRYEAYIIINMNINTEAGKLTYLSDLRLKAEEILGKTRSETESTPKEKEWYSHDLEIHQIELEMQNDELNLQIKKAEAYAHRYLDLYNNASSSQFTLSKAGEILQLNLFGAEVLKKKQSHLMLSRFGFFVSESNKTIFNDFLDKVFSSKIRQTCEVMLALENEKPKYVQLTGISNSNNDECHLTVTDISRIKKIKQKLSHILSVMDATLESVHNGILVINNHGAVIKCNNQFKEMWHLSDEIIDSGDDNLLLACIMDQLVSPSEFKTKVSELYALPETESEDVIYFRDGRIFERISKPMFIGKKVEGRVWSFLDVTEQTLARDANLRINFRLESIIEGTHIGTWEWNIRTGDAVLNEEWANMIGYTLEELAPTSIKTWERLCYPEDLIKSVNLLERHFSGELPYYNCEFRMKHKLGHWIWILDRGRVATRTSEGEPLLMFGTHSVITERKLAEEALIASEKKANALIAAMPDMMFILNSNGVYLDFKAAREDLSYQSESIIGKKNRDIMPVKFADLIDEKIALIIQSGEMQLFEYELELPLKGRCNFEARMGPGCSDEFIAIVRDITERKHDELLIQSKNEELQKVNAAKDKFFSIIAHDLRGPLGGFLGITEMMAEGSESFTESEKKEMITNLSLSARNTFTLLENLLEWSQMERGLTAFKPQHLEIFNIINQCVGLNIENARKKMIDLTFDIADNPEVFGDPNMLLTVIRNLLSNAIKFTPKGGKVTVSVVKADNNMTCISVRDTGIGMSEKMRSDLFRIDSNIKRLGTQGEASTGLGLLLCKEFVDKHEGEIIVESTPNQGSVFSFTIPSVGYEKNRPGEILTKSAPGIIKPVGNLTVLIAEDDEISLKLISAMIKGFSKQIFDARTGVEAVQICRENPDIDLVLMDMAMPVMTGYEATSLIRKFNTKIIILAQTAFASSADRELSLKSGCNDLIAKPFKKEVLIELVKKYLK